MPNLLQRGAAWLGTRLQATAGRVVTYTRKNASPLTITASMTTKAYEVIGDNNFLTIFVSSDWLITQTDLGGLTPRSGDKIVESINGETHTYEVMPIDDKRQCCEAKDTSEILLTVHSKRTGVA